MTTLETQRVAYLKGFNDAAKGKWISVKDRLPPYEERVLLRIFMNKNEYIIKGWNCHDDPDDREGNFLYEQPPYDYEDDEIKFRMETDAFTIGSDLVTHWMPLPPPPAVE